VSVHECTMLWNLRKPRALDLAYARVLRMHAGPLR